MAEVLLVADVSRVVDKVCSALSEARFSVSTLDDPHAVAEALSESEIDIVLVDHQVDNMGGMAVARTVRATAATTAGVRPALILLLDRDADAFLAGRSGADGWIRKPFSSDALRNAIEKVLTVVADPS